MENTSILKKSVHYAGLFLLLAVFTACSDDDNDIHSELPPITGSIQIFNGPTLSGNVLTVPGVTVNQDSWLAALPADKENTDDFIAQPVFVEKGTSLNVKLTFDESVVNYNKQIAQVVLKLFVDNQKDGIQGEWDSSDQPISTANNLLAMRSITIYADLTNYNPFSHSFDLNLDGMLDLQEVSRTYPNNFDSMWDIDKSGDLDKGEFYNTAFLNTDSNWDNLISEAEWKEGYLLMFGEWAENNFPGFDENKDGRLSRNEWNKIFIDSEFFKYYDADDNNIVTPAELNQGFFEQWDLNNDIKINEAEFNIYRPYVMNWTTYGYWDH